MNRLLVPLLLLALPKIAQCVDVTAASAIAIDEQSGKILWAKDADALRYPASTTKIMTGMLLLEHCKPSDTLTAPDDIKKVRESSMHLEPGEKVTAHDMLYALMLRSANDGCYAVAVHIAGSVPAFSDLMNRRAKEIGCTHTHFDNPNGLNDPLHYTTAHDLALIAREAMRYPEFREAVRTYKYQIERSINQHDRVMVNHDKWLKKDPTCEGIKTGFTNPAGHCFVGCSSRDGFGVITVVLKSRDWQADHKSLLDWSFKQFEVKDKVGEGQVFANAPVIGGVKEQVPAATAVSTDVIGKKGTDLSDKKIFVPDGRLVAPIRKGQRIGEYQIVESDGFTQHVPAVAAADVAAVSTVGSISKAGPKGPFEILGAAVCVGAIYMRGRGRRTSKIYGRTRTRPF
jgi:D-alanyl-D-alanine carboxypeptidase